MQRRGFLWEHLVLDMLRVWYRTVYYWTDKNKNEIDFIVKGERGELHTIECKIKPYKLSYGDLEVNFQSVPQSSIQS
jgi:predicted AAA+ superfamily ATPase